MACEILSSHVSIGFTPWIIDGRICRAVGHCSATAVPPRALEKPLRRRIREAVFVIPQ